MAKCGSCGSICQNGCAGCGGCTVRCADTCSANCVGSCIGTCLGKSTKPDTLQCTQCKNDCTGSCNKQGGGCVSCGGACTTTCDTASHPTDPGGSCGSCSSSCTGTCENTGGSCSSCSTDCTGGCKDTCNQTCTGTCDKTCTTTCNNVCLDVCNNACQSQAMLSFINTFGENIINGGYIKAKDFSDIKYALGVEFKRRHLPYNEALFYGPAAGTYITPEQTNSSLKLATTLGFEGAPLVNQFQIVMKKDLEKMILFLRQKMLECVL